jgi:hypothetical protein
MFLLQLAQMLFVSFVNQIDQPPIKELLTDAAFRAPAKNNGLRFGPKAR